LELFLPRAMLAQAPVPQGRGPLTIPDLTPAQIAEGRAVLAEIRANPPWDNRIEGILVVGETVAEQRALVNRLGRILRARADYHSAEHLDMEYAQYRVSEVLAEVASAVDPSVQMLVIELANEFFHAKDVVFSQTALGFQALRAVGTPEALEVMRRFLREEGRDPNDNLHIQSLAAIYESPLGAHVIERLRRTDPFLSAWNVLPRGMPGVRSACSDICAIRKVFMPFWKPYAGCVRAPAPPVSRLNGWPLGHSWKGLVIRERNTAGAIPTKRWGWNPFLIRKKRWCGKAI